MKNKVEIMLRNASLYTNEIHMIMDGLEELEFFDAPASRSYHLAYEGGLAEHSLNVAEQLAELTKKNVLKWENPRSPYVVGLLHDLCKCDAYIKTKDGFDMNKNMLIHGHGDKSVMLAGRIIKLTEEEMCCIRYHMGAYYKKDWEGFDKAIKRYPNVLWTHMADMIASKLVEK